MLRSEKYSNILKILYHVSRNNQVLSSKPYQNQFIREESKPSSTNQPHGSHFNQYKSNLNYYRSQHKGKSRDIIKYRRIE